MTKAEIEKLINHLRLTLDKDVGEEGIMCKVSDVFNALREYPVESDKTCGPNYKGMYEVNAMELDKAQRTIESLKSDMHKLSIKYMQYAGAVAAMETIFGRKFNLRRWGVNYES